MKNISQEITENFVDKLTNELSCHVEGGRTNHIMDIIIEGLSKVISINNSINNAIKESR